MAILAHLLGMAVCVFTGSGLGFVAPLIIWMIKKDESAFVAEHAKQAMIFQIALIVFSILAVIGGLALSCLTGGLALPLLILAALLIVVCAIVYPILAAIEANKGRMYYYPVVGDMF